MNQHLGQGIGQLVNKVKIHRMILLVRGRSVCYAFFSWWVEGTCEIIWFYYSKHLPPCRFAGCTTNDCRTSAGWWQLTGLYWESVSCFSTGEGPPSISAFLYCFLSGITLFIYCIFCLFPICSSLPTGVLCTGSGAELEDPASLHHVFLLLQASLDNPWFE